MAFARLVAKFTMTAHKKHINTVTIEQSYQMKISATEYNTPPTKTNNKHDGKLTCRLGVDNHRIQGLVLQDLPARGRPG